MNHLSPHSLNRSTLLVGCAALLLAGCATRPPRVSGPPEKPVMPPATSGQGREIGLPPPVEVNFNPMESAPLPTQSPSIVKPAPVSRPAPAPRPGTPYTIKQGESLSAVAARNNMSWVKLAEYNRIADPNKVRVGQVILIPGTSTKPAPSVSSRPAPPPAPANRGNTYVVQSGDNLTTVARRHNTTVDDLKAVNNLRSDRLLVGQILKLPTGSSKPSGSSTAPVAAAPAPRPTVAPRAAIPTPQPTPVMAAPAVTDVPEAAEDPLVDKPFTIVVMEGDTLESIAANYVVSVEKIRELNNLPADAELTPGQKLEMPPGLY